MTSRSWPCLFFAALVLPLFAGCGLLRKKPQPQPKAPDPIAAGKAPLGKIESVDGRLGFVLIRTRWQDRIDPGTPLDVRRPDGTIGARLVASPERKRLFIAADIAEGTPEPGADVYLAPAQQKASEAPAEPIAPAGLPPLRPPSDELPPPADPADDPAEKTDLSDASDLAFPVPSARPAAAPASWQPHSRP